VILSLGAFHAAHADDIIPQLPGDEVEQSLRDKGGPLERTIAVLVGCPLELIAKLMETGGFVPIDRLVFGTGLTDDEKALRPWSTEQQKADVYKWFWGMTGVVLPFFAFVVAGTAFKLMLAAANPAQRAEAIESIWRWLGALLIIIFAPLLLHVMLWMSHLLTDGIAAGFDSLMAGSGRTTDSWGGINWAGVNVVTGSVLGTAIVKVAFGLAFIYMNALYIIRGLTLTVMLVFTPFVALMWAVNKNVQAAGQWIGEMMSNAAMPVAHALVLCTILLLADPAALRGEGGALEGTWAILLVMMYALIPLSEAVRNSMVGLFNRWAGVSEENVAHRAAAGILGVGALFGLGKALGGAVRRPGGGVPIPRPDTGGPPPPVPGPAPGPAPRPPQPLDRYARPQEYADRLTGQQQALPPREAARRRMRRAADTVAHVGGRVEEAIGRVAGGSIPGASQTAKLAAGMTRKGLEYGIKGGYYVYEAAQRIKAGEGVGKVLRSYAGEVKARYSPFGGSSLDGPRHR
jgi:hypothetical protein